MSKAYLAPAQHDILVELPDVLGAVREGILAKTLSSIIRETPIVVGSISIANCSSIIEHPSFKRATVFEAFELLICPVSPRNAVNHLSSELVFVFEVHRTFAVQLSLLKCSCINVIPNCKSTFPLNLMGIRVVPIVVVTVSEIDGPRYKLSTVKFTRQILTSFELQRTLALVHAVDKLSLEGCELGAIDKVCRFSLLCCTIFEETNKNVAIVEFQLAVAMRASSSIAVAFVD